MRMVVVGMVVAGCSSPHAASDAASGDAGGDGPCIGDRDGDGVCDAVDLCPDVPDPGQFDPDGDGIGWMCDPLESIALPPPAFVAVPFQAWIHGDTFASAMVTGCTSEFTCDYAIVMANADGHLVARGDSGRPEDTWLASTYIQGPFVTPDDQVYLSRQFMDDVQRVHVSTGTVTKALDGFFWDPAVLDGAHVVFPERLHDVTDEGNLLVYQAGQLANVGSTNGIVQVLEPPLAPGPSAVFAIYSTFNTKGSLQTYQLGDASIAPVTVGGVAITDEAKLMVLDTAANGELPLCLDRGTGASYVGLRATGATATPLPSDFKQCVLVAYRVGSMEFLRGANLTANTATIAVVKNGVVTTPPALAGFSNSLEWNVLGDQIPVVQLLTDGGAFPSKYVAIAPDGTGVVLHSSLHDAAVSTRGDTVHVVGNDDSNALVLVRYRPSTGVQQVTLAAFGSSLPHPVTTREGGVVVGPYAVPSTSMTPTTLSLAGTSDGSAGGVTGDYTLIRATTNLGKPVLAVYRETGGVPTLTQISQADAVLFGESPWFAYFNSTVECAISRVVDDGTGQLSLDASIPCLTWNNISPVGVRANGDMIVGDAGASLFLLSPSGVTKVVSNATNLGVIKDDAGTIVGWIGADATGGFACLASHPERCWSIPDPQLGDGAVLYRWADASYNEGDGRFVVAEYAYSESKLYIFRSIGAGDRAPPM